jgi:cellobiose phosphorylase
MRERLCSAWTVTLQVQTAHALATALRACGRTALAIRLDALAARTRIDFQRLLIPGGTLAGFAYFHPDRPIQYLLHPSDTETGIHYRLLPMIHAVINHMLTPEQARHHIGLMRTQLLAPDGARLFDRPPQYRGGAMRFFQRAESSTYFGREIGIMYTHAHLRYAEAMATAGEADAFWLALRQAIPIGIRDVIPNARPRQANTYASSSDAAFGDRYEAQEHYAQVRNGEVPVEGGWRTYSSGAGIAFRLIHERLFGFRRGRSTLVIDPVLPRSLDGLALDVTLAERPVHVRYVVGEVGAGPVALDLNGALLPFEREPNPYRTGGALVTMAELGARLKPTDNVLTIRLG